MQKTNIQKWLLKTNLIATNDMVKQKKIPWHVFVTLMAQVQNESFLTDDLPQNHDIPHDIAHK